MATKESLKLLYCCECCAENNPEMCGFFNRKDLRVANDGTWLCESCWDESEDALTGGVAFGSHLFIPPKCDPPRGTERIYLDSMKSE